MMSILPQLTMTAMLKHESSPCPLLQPRPCRSPSSARARTVRAPGRATRAPSQMSRAPRTKVGPTQRKALVEAFSLIVKTDGSFAAPFTFYNMLCSGGAGSRSKSQRHRVRRQSPVEERLSVHESDSMSDAFDDEGLFQIDENFAKFLDDKTSCQK